MDICSKTRQTTLNLENTPEYRLQVSRFWLTTLLRPPSTVCLLYRSSLQTVNIKMIHRRSLPGTARPSWLPEFTSVSSPGDKGRRGANLYKHVPFNHYRSYGMMTYKNYILLFAVITAACTLSGYLAHHLLQLGTPIEDMYTWKSMSRPKPVPGKNPTRGASLSSSSVAVVPSKHYIIPDTMSRVGDKSDFYAALRMAYDSLYPNNVKRSMKAAQEHQLYSFDAVRPSVEYDNEDELPFDIYNCPNEPPENYPFGWKILDILHQWPADDPEPRKELFQGICVFDFVKDQDKALVYRNAEVPFVIKGDPQVAKTVERWNTPHYMEALLGDEVEYEAEHSESNHFLFWDTSKAQSHQRKTKSNQVPWKQPTQMVRMTYTDWLDHANVTDDKLGPNDPHWYFKLMACGTGRCTAVPSEFLFDELPFFQPKQTSLYLKEPNMQRGILCRFGMKGVIAENHFDGGRNVITVLKGERRYILAHPNQCDKLALYPEGHPSARHSAVDWSDPDLDKYPQFAEAVGNEVVLQAGDTLYMPTHWFHYIVSLSTNFQCNTRSGLGSKYVHHLHQCGFT